jgi:predicted DNA-binding transcriptional regulator YafY
MAMDETTDRLTAKRDRLARFYRVLRVLQAYGEQGVRIEEIARRVGMSKRTVYRDLRALEDEIGVPVWSEDGRWGVESGAFLPPLRLTVPEAMAVVISARLMTRYADTYDPDLGAAFQKLEEGLPAALRDHVERTLEILSRRRFDERVHRAVRDLTRAWAERRVVTFLYTGAYGPDREPRRARVRPYLLEPSVQTHALYLIGHDEERGGMRTFKVDRMTEVAVAAETFEPPEEGAMEELLGRAWDIIADQPEVEVVLRFAPGVAARVREATWHPTEQVTIEPDGWLRWSARVSGTIEIRLWILSWGSDVEVLSPASLREDVAGTLRQALERY